MLKVHSHVTSAFAIFFDLCRPILENVNVKSLVAIEPILDI